VRETLNHDVLNEYMILEYTRFSKKEKYLTPVKARGRVNTIYSSELSLKYRLDTFYAPSLQLPEENDLPLITYSNKLRKIE